MVALNFTNYNFTIIHQALRVALAMDADISNHVWDLEEIIGLQDSN